MIYESNNIVYEKMPDFKSEIIDPDGFLVIGKVYYRFTPEYQYIIFGDDQSLIEKAKSGKFDDKVILRIKKNTVKKNAKIEVYGCTWLGGYQINGSNTRRIETHLWVIEDWTYVGNDPITGATYVHLGLSVENVGNSFKKGGFWGNWQTYRTDHVLRSNYEVKASINGVQKIQESVDILKTSNDVEQIRFSNYISQNVTTSYPVYSVTRSVYWLSNGKHYTVDVPSPGAQYNSCYGNSN